MVNRCQLNDGSLPLQMQQESKPETFCCEMKIKSSSRLSPKMNLANELVAVAN